MNRRLFIASIFGAVAARALPQSQDFGWALSAENSQHYLGRIPDGPLPKQQAAIDSESRFVMVTGGRGSGKSWTLQRIAEKESERGGDVGVIFGSFAAGQDWRFKRAAVRPYRPEDLLHGRPCPRILIVDNVECLNGDDFYAVAAAVVWEHAFRVIVASMPHGENERTPLVNGFRGSRKDFLLRYFESYHLGSVFDNPHLMADPAYATAMRDYYRVNR